MCWRTFFEAASHIYDIRFGRFPNGVAAQQRPRWSWLAGVIGSDVSTCWWHWLGQHQRVVPRRTQLTDQFPESLKPLKCLSMFVDVCRVCPTGQYVRSVPRKIICAAIWRRGLVGRLPGCLASILLRDLCLSCSCSVWWYEICDV